MRSISRLAAALIAAGSTVLVSSCAPAVQLASLSVPTTIHDVQEQDQRPRVSPPLLELDLAPEKPGSIKDIPSLASPPLWAVPSVAGHDVPIGIAKDENHQLHVLIDQNGDGVLKGDQEVLKVPGKELEGRGEVFAVSWRQELTVGGRKLALVAISYQKGKGPVQASLMGSGYREGLTRIGDQEMMLVVVDQNFDGRYGTPGDLWWLGSKKRAESMTDRPLYRFNMYDAKDPIFVDGRAWRLDGLAEDTAQVREDPDAGTLEEYLTRRTAKVNKEWFAHFDKEKKRFIAAKGVDTSRPTLDEPIHFHHLLDLDAALALARAQKKPLFLDFEADWCVWCKRLDYYTYPDKEVGSWLERFVPVKWNCELDPNDVAARYDVKGYPCMVILDADGRSLKTISGWLKPADMVEQLKEAYGEWERAKKGGETKPAAEPTAPQGR